MATTHAYVILSLTHCMLSIQTTTNNSARKELLWWLAVLCTGGLLYIVMTWMPKLRAQLRYEPVGCDDTTAELVLLQVTTSKIHYSKLKHAIMYRIIRMSNSRNELLL
jgi:P5-type ATPase cation transporter